MSLNPSQGVFTPQQVGVQHSPLAYPFHNQQVSDPTPSLQPSSDLSLDASRLMLDSWRLNIPLDEVRPVFQNLIASKLDSQITSLKQRISTHFEEFQDFALWCSEFDKNKSFDGLPERFACQLYHWVWLKEGALPIWDHGKEVAHSRPDSLLSECPFVLPFEGRNFLDQFYQMQLNQHDIFTKNLHALFLQTWGDILSCQELSQQDKKPLVEKLFQIANLCSQEALFSLMKKIYIPLQERKLWGQHDFGQIKLRSDCTVLQSLIDHEALVASYFPNKGLHRITSMDELKAAEYLLWRESVKVGSPVEEILSSFNHLDSDIQNQIYELVYLDHIVSNAAFEMENHDNSSCQFLRDAVENEKKSRIKEYQEKVNHLTLKIESFIQEQVEPSSFSLNLKRALIEKLSLDIKATSFQRCRVSDDSSDLMRSVLSQYFQSFPFAEKMISQSPITRQLIEMQNSSDVSFDVMFSELWLRMEMMNELFHLLQGLAEKYGDIEHDLSDPNHIMHKYLNQFFMKVMHVPTLDLHQEKSVLLADFHKIYMIFQDLLTKFYRPEEVLFYCTKVLEHAIDKPSDEMIASMHKLFSVQKQVMVEMSSNAMQPSGASLFKTIFEVNSQEAKGKFKPLDAAGKCCESSSYVYDKIAKLGLTQPTQSFEMTALKNYHAAVSNKSCDEACKALYRLIPSCIKEMMFRLSHEILQAHPDILKDITPDSLPSVLSQEDQKQIADISMSRVQEGSIQLWIEGKVVRAYDLLTQNACGGKMIYNIPHTWVHLHVLSSLIKGSEDNSSGNTIFVLSDDEQQILAIKEFDDERSLPVQSTYEQLRLWQLGLPQSNIPFDRAFMMLFTNEMWLEKIKQHNQLYRIPKDKSDEQIRRVTCIIDLFNQTLKNESLRLTPRDLFFAIAGGKEKYQELLKSTKSPWEIFERDLKGCGLELPFYSDFNHDIVQSNLQVLYHPESFVCNTL
jgi:hypothetical protein